MKNQGWKARDVVDTKAKPPKALPPSRFQRIPEASACPCCGGDPRLWEDARLTWICCADCGLLTRGQLRLETALANWNRRTVA